MHFLLLIIIYIKYIIYLAGNTSERPTGPSLGQLTSENMQIKQAESGGKRRKDGGRAREDLQKKAEGIVCLKERRPR